MATVQHVSIPDAQIHEPKGVVTASAGYVYVANGGGSGIWKKVANDALQGLSGDAGVSGKKIISDGANGFIMRTDAAYGVMVVNGNTNNFAMTAAVDPTLNTTTDYVQYTGTGAPLASENLFGVTFITNRLIVPVTGLYRLDLWASVKSFPGATAKVGALYRVNASGAFATRNFIAKSGAAGDEAELTGFDLVQLTANDFVSLYLASTVTGNLIIEDLAFMVTLVRQTA